MDKCAKTMFAYNDFENLKELREHVKWSVKEERYEFLRNLCILIKVWEGELPNLRKIFTNEEIEDILFDCVNYWRMDNGCTTAITDFVVRCGYRDEPSKLDENEKPLLNRTTPLHHVSRSVWTLQKTVTLRNLFQIYNRFDANYSDETGFTHFHIACKYGFYREVEKFLAAGQRPDCLARETDDTPLHVALASNGLEVAQLLLQRGADPNLPNRAGVTPLHIVCDRAHSDELTDMFFELSYQKYQTLKIDVQDQWGRTPLLLAVAHDLGDLMKLLLRRGADPNTANEDGRTPLHIICARERDPLVMVSEFFMACYKQRRVVNVNCRDRSGRTPLQGALSRGRREVSEFLLKNGADPHFVDGEGTTALHVIATRGDEYWADALLRISYYDGCFPLLIDPRDRLGNTPLHLALRHGHKQLAAYLLRCGAYPNLINDDGSTPLHIICSWDEKYNEDAGLIKSFFEINDRLLQGVLVDAKDKKGRTPLQLAVANIYPEAIDLLLDYGADASNFVFPAKKDFDVKKFRIRCRDKYITYELWLASGLLAAVDRLEKAGWEMERSAVETIMKLFADNGLFERSANLTPTTLPDFVGCSQRLMINSSVSLYELTRLTPKEAKKRVTFMDYFKSAHDMKWWMLHYAERVPLAVNLCEKFARKFFEFWALVPFMQLKNYRLPIECCELILENLNNQDLYNICLAARGENCTGTADDTDPDDDEARNPEIGISHSAALSSALWRSHSPPCMPLYMEVNSRSRGNKFHLEGRCCPATTAATIDIITLANIVARTFVSIYLFLD
ncbi:unnamed protein product [Trichogramma brassicae]|uniref:Uncharacterized protein n=1 Tax=Trichogramma brassicae TaxID=86971 RepID=A0A6H5ID49_9HYME|nr:unnamed protein product [Trichogramma brassicae]